MTVRRTGGYKNRPYRTRAGRREEVNVANHALVKKDFVLIDSKGKQYGVPVPSPVSGYAGKVGQGWGAVNIYADKKMTKLIAQVGHMIDLQVKNGQRIEYGQTLGGQAGAGKKGSRTYGVHIDMSATPEVYRRYIKDLQSGVFASGQQSSNRPQAQPQRVNSQSSSGKLKRGGNDLSSEEYGKLTSYGKKLYELRNNPYVLAINDAVARAEGTDFRKWSKNYGYGMLIGNENLPISELDKGHPFVEGGRGYRHNSSAAGRNQAMDFNYSRSRAKRQFGKGAVPDMQRLFNLGGADNIGSFSPGIQDLYFLHSLKYRGVLDKVLKGQFDQDVFNRLAPHYASISYKGKKSYYGGQGTPEGRYSNIKNFAYQRLKVRQSSPQNPSQPTQATQSTSSPSGGDAEDPRNLITSRRKLDQKNYREIKAEVEFATEKANSTLKQKRELGAQKRAQIHKEQKSQYQLDIAKTPNPENKKLLERQLKRYEMDYKHEEEIIKLSQKREDLVKAREIKLKVIAEAEKRGKKVDLGKEAGLDYSKAIKQLNEIIVSNQKIHQQELEIEKLKNVANPEQERNRARQREIDQLNRAHGEYIDKLRLEQSLVSDESVKQEISAKIDKASTVHQGKLALIDYQNKLEDLENKKVFLLGKGGLSKDSKEVVELQKEIDNLNTQIAATSKKTGVDLKIFENQRKLLKLDKERQRNAEQLTRTYEEQIASLQYEQSLSPSESGKQYLQTQIDRAEKEFQIKMNLLPLRNQLEDLRNDKRSLLGSGIKKDSEQIKQLNQRIGDTEAQIQSISKTSGLDLAAFENQVKQLELERNRQLEFNQANREQLEHINNLKLLQSTIPNETIKQEIEFIINKTQLENQVKQELFSLQNQLKGLNARKVRLLGEQGLNEDSEEVKRLQQEIDELNSQIQSISNNSGIDLKLLENQQQLFKQNNERLKEAQSQERQYNKQVTELQSQVSKARTQQQKAELQFQLDKIAAMREEQQLLQPLRQQYDALVKSRERLISENKLNENSEIIKGLDEQIAQLNTQIKEVGNQSKTNFDILAKESQKAIEQAKFADKESALNKEAGLIDSSATLAQSQAGMLRDRGLEYRASKIEAGAAKAQEEIRYKQELLQIERQIAEAKGTANEYTEEEITTLMSNAEAINKINLENISSQVRTLGKDLLDVTKNALGGFFTDLISGSKSASQAFSDFIGNIANQLTQLAVNKLIANLFGGGLFGGGGKIPGLSGGGGIFGFYQGGIVPNYAYGGSVKAVSDALNRERAASGRNPVLAALTPGEMVLTVQQAKRFQELQLDKVLNFANGGIVGGTETLKARANAEGMIINVPVTFQNNNQQNSSVDVPKLQNSLRTAVVDILLREQRPGGALNR